MNTICTDRSRTSISGAISWRPSMSSRHHISPPRLKEAAVEARSTAAILHHHTTCDHSLQNASECRSYRMAQAWVFKSCLVKGPSRREYMHDFFAICWRTPGCETPRQWHATNICAIDHQHLHESRKTAMDWEWRKFMRLC